MVVEKFCKDCGELRPASDFTRDRARKDGLSFYCKTHARRRLLASKDARKGPAKSRHPREVVVPEGHKWCPDCGTVKPLDEFVRNAGMPSGRAPYCKPCHNARGKRRRTRWAGRGPTTSSGGTGSRLRTPMRCSRLRAACAPSAALR